MKKPLPPYITYGSPEEARTLLEACRHLCLKIGIDKVMKNLLPVKKVAGLRGDRNVPVGRIPMCITSPYNEEKSASEEFFSSPFNPFKK